MFEADYDRPPLDERESTGFIATQSRDQITFTAGDDMTFSPVKRFSASWTVAPPEFAKVLEGIHDQGRRRYHRGHRKHHGVHADGRVNSGPTRAPTDSSRRRSPGRDSRARAPIYTRTYRSETRSGHVA